MAVTPEARTRPPRRTQAERSAESAQRLLDAAIELISEKGFERTTAAEIGQRAGYSRSMVRDRYGSKEALLESLVSREFQARLLPPARVRRKANGLGRVLAQLDDLLAAVEREPDIMRALIVLAFEATGPIAGVRPWMRRLIDGFEAEMIEHLKSGQRDGSIRPGVDAAYEAQHYVSYGIGLCYRWVLYGESFDFPAAIRAWRARLRRSLRPA